MRIFYPTTSVINNTVWLFLSSKCTFYTNLSSGTLEFHISSIVHRMTHVHQGHINSCDLEYLRWTRARLCNGCQCWRSVVKAIVRFYRIDSDPALKAFKSRIPINNGNWTEWSSICLKSYAWFSKWNERARYLLSTGWRFIRWIALSSLVTVMPPLNNWRLLHILSSLVRSLQRPFNEGEKTILPMTTPWGRGGLPLPHRERIQRAQLFLLKTCSLLLHIYFGFSFV